MKKKITSAVAAFLLVGACAGFAACSPQASADTATDSAAEASATSEDASAEDDLAAAIERAEAAAEKAEAAAERAEAAAAKAEKAAGADAKTDADKKADDKDAIAEDAKAAEEADTDAPAAPVEASENSLIAFHDSIGMDISNLTEISVDACGSCHGDLAAIQAETEDILVYEGHVANPHKNHMRKEFKCTDCHSLESQSHLGCNDTCHTWEMTQNNGTWDEE